MRKPSLPTLPHSHRIASKTRLGCVDSTQSDVRKTHGEERPQVSGRDRCGSGNGSLGSAGCWAEGQQRGRSCVLVLKARSPGLGESSCVHSSRESSGGKRQHRQCKLNQQLPMQPQLLGANLSVLSPPSSTLGGGTSWPLQSGTSSALWRALK